jgi:hypothetical protein
MRTFLFVGVIVVLTSSLFLSGCGSAPKTPSPESAASAAPEKKQPVLYTGKNCMSQMQVAAARWQADAVPIHLESGLNAESNGQNGKSTIWQGMFASPSRGTWRSFTCSGSRLKEEPAIGVSGSMEMASSPETATAMFQPLLLIVDSDKAFETAQENGGATILKKNPEQPVLYSLNWDAKTRKLVWAVMYGTSHSDSKGTGLIDATSGKFLGASK